uniref:RRM domain-containing protein n=1 Tax=Steinernema glaseri TaxID=37863 RepID=A0A1I7ZN11_9BILA
MFDKLIIECGGSTSAIVGFSCTSAILNVTLRDNLSASALVKRFQEKRTRHELSSAFKNCRVYFNLPGEFRERRQGLLKEVARKNASSDGEKFYVDEFDLTVKSCQKQSGNSVVFDFSKSNLVNIGNANNKFHELVILCGGFIEAIVNVNCPPTRKILIITFRDEISAGRIVQTFQEKKNRDELSPEFKFCRISFNLSKEPQTGRSNGQRVGVNNLHVNEYNFTVPRNPRGETAKPVHCTNIVYFNFYNSKIRVENAENKFRELVVLCGRSTNEIDIADCMPAQKILKITFRSEESASTVLKTFQDWKIRDKLSFEFKSCYIYFHLPKHLQTRRNELYKDLRKTAGYGVENLYVDEYDLKVKKKPAGSRFDSWPGNSPRQSTSRSVRQAAAQDVRHYKSYHVSDFVLIQNTEIECPTLSKVPVVPSKSGVTESSTGQGLPMKTSSTVFYIICYICACRV